MAKANSLSPIGISAVKVLARLAAKRAVQDNLRAEGVRVSLFPNAELMRLAAEYLANHPELYVAALERAKRMTAEGVRTSQNQRVRLCISQVQNGWRNEHRAGNRMAACAAVSWASKEARNKEQR